MSSDLVLVAGASGYVAGHCMLRLLHDGHRVALCASRRVASAV